MKLRKKLIEVALPLEAINVASVRESYIYRGNPSSLHKWWAQRPLAAARAILFAQMIDDPSENLDRFPDQVAQNQERQRLFGLIEDLAKWESTTDHEMLGRASQEIWASWHRACDENSDDPNAQEIFDPSKLPAFHDPFAGGGTLPLEAQRLGFESYASDLNPVSVLINKAMIEFPFKFSGQHPVNPETRNNKALFKAGWTGAKGIAEDVRYYAKWMQGEAARLIGDIYPRVEITSEMAGKRPDLRPLVGQKLGVIAWLWARTVRSPNPAFSNIYVPLASTFMLSTKQGKEVYVNPVVRGDTYEFVVVVGKPKDQEQVKHGTKLARGANFACALSHTPISPDYIYAQAIAGHMGSRLMAAVVESDIGRLYLSPTVEMEDAARTAIPSETPQLEMPDNPRWFSPPLYGLKTYGDLFTPRQLVALTTFSDLVLETRRRTEHDAVAAGLMPDAIPLAEGGTGAAAYADAIAVYLAFGIDKYSMYGNSLVPWYAKEDRPSMLFSRQALPMVWDYTEINPFSTVGGGLAKSLSIVAGALDGLPDNPVAATVVQEDATKGTLHSNVVISTDPPYYDNIGYADLSDFFYVWLRRSLRPIMPGLFGTLAVPKAEELVATPYRHGGKENAEAFFLAGMTEAMHRLSQQAHPSFPITIYYAFKQSETKTAGQMTSTGWETFLDAVIRAGFAITGTWPVRTEREGRSVGSGTNALASSIVLVCRQRSPRASSTTRREFITVLKSELPSALAHLQRGNIAPVDLAQAAIGPGMAVYTRYAKVVDAAGNPLSVREALGLINQTLDEALAEQEGDFDADTRWALTWFEDVGFADGPFGKAELLSKSKNTSVDGMVEAKIVTAKGGKVRLLRPDELPPDWDPVRDARLTLWEVVHQVVRRLESGGEISAAELVSVLGDSAEVARELAYRLYTICERKKRAPEALSYNALVQSWPEIMRLARDKRPPHAAQGQMFQ